MRTVLARAFSARCPAAGWVLLLFGLALPAAAHNGPMATAAPVAGITVDGRLADWPDDLTVYPVSLWQSGDAPQDSLDLRADFRVGFDAGENALYVAVEVRDQSAGAVPGTQPFWNTRDGCELYLDTGHSRGSQESAQYALYGDQRNAYGIGRLEDMEVMSRREGERLVYEWRLDLTRRLAGTHLGFDLSVCDMDEDGSSSWVSWGPGTGKASAAERRGDLYLAGGEVPSGRIQGRVRRTDSDSAAAWVFVQISQRKERRVHFLGTADVQGEFTLELPVGEYMVETWLTRDKPDSVCVEIEEGKEKKVELRLDYSSLASVEGQFSSFLEGVFTSALFQDREGALWFGTAQGVYRYDGEKLTHFTALHGLPGDHVKAIAADREGRVCYGARGGVSRYDGERFVPLIAVGGARAILATRDGGIWGGGVDGLYCYDGEKSTRLELVDGRGSVSSLLEDRRGHLWIGFWGGGAARYDGNEVLTFSAPGQLVSDLVGGLAEDHQGNIWFATPEGVCRYDGAEFTTLSRENGLESEHVTSLLVDRRDHLWLGTFDRGVFRYDGAVLQRLGRREGLVDNAVRALLEDREGAVWIATEGGISRYQSRSEPPAVPQVKVETDRGHGAVAQLRVPAPLPSVRFSFGGGATGLVHAYRLQGHQEEWRQTRVGQVGFDDLPRGDYLFQVKAVDPDLNYSAPAEVRLTVHLPYGTLALATGLGLALIGLAVAGGYAVRQRRDRDRAREALVRELEEELQMAHQLQMGLMPKEAPKVAGIELAGRCIPATHVGGDFFQYFPQAEGLAVCMADVTGHAMEAAVPVMMFSGVLHSQMEEERGLEELFARLNRTLHARLEDRTFVCFAMGCIEANGRILRLVNMACPPPYHFRAATGEVVELEGEGYPLGVIPEAEYAAVETPLEPGDYVIFCSDGIVEAENAAGELFGFERTARTIHQACGQGLSAVHTLERIVAAVDQFTGDTPAGDDRTCIVIGVK